MAETSAFEHETRERLNRMERALRRWRVGAVIALPLAAVMLLGAMVDAPVNELRVHTLRIVDKAGTDRIVLTADPTLPDMTFFDPQGKSRLTLDIAADLKPVLQFSDAGKETGGIILGLEEGSPQLQLFDPRRKKRVAIGVPKQGGPIIRIMGEDGKLQMRFP
jgi:hypothetical protein